MVSTVERQGNKESEVPHTEYTLFTQRLALFLGSLPMHKSLGTRLHSIQIHSCTSHTLCREEGFDHAATIELVVTMAETCCDQ